MSFRPNKQCPGGLLVNRNRYPPPYSQSIRRLMDCGAQLRTFRVELVALSKGLPSESRYGPYFTLETDPDCPHHPTLYRNEDVD